MARVYQPSPRQVAAKLNGAKGGRARAAKLSAVQRSAIAAKAGMACFDLYGSDLYRSIRRKRKHLKRSSTHGKVKAKAS